MTPFFRALAAHGATESLARGPAMMESAAVHQEKRGDLIGRHKLLQEIGESACGVVSVAAKVLARFL